MSVLSFPVADGSCFSEQRRARPNGVPLLVQSTGTAAARRTLRPGDSWIIGSAPSSDLVVSGACERHCLLRHQGTAVEIEDLQSATGVRIAGARVRWAELPLSASVELGGATLRLSPAAETTALPGMIGRSASMRSLAELVGRVASTSMPVLLRGETGTGKELAARAIHGASRRASGPFVAINGATVTSSLGLSLLFGHVTGAYTGATNSRLGAFREAHGGSLFIDELGSLPPEAQAALLRAIEEGVIVPIGADRGTAVDVRLIAATCEPVEELTASGEFRLDLYQRLSVCVVEIPPLRERKGDIPLLAEHLLACSELAGCRLDSPALDVLRAEPWPGNIRELRNVLLHAALRCQNRVIRAADIVAVLTTRRPTRQLFDPTAARDLLDQSAGHLSAAARRANLPRSTFRDLLRRG